MEKLSDSISLIFYKRKSRLQELIIYNYYGKTLLANLLYTIGIVLYFKKPFEEAKEYFL